MEKKKALILIILLSIFGVSAAQNEISNVRVQVVDTIVVITYDLEVKADIKAFISLNNDGKFMTLKEVSGAVGKGILPEKNKIIIWNVVKELGYVDFPNAVIKVEANPIVEVKPIEPVVEEKKLSPKEIRRLANQNLNGHNFSIGSSIFSCGYYGMFGVGYEFRYKIIGLNISLGYGLHTTNLSNLNWYDNFYETNTRNFININAGMKFYLSNKKKNVRNLYLNILPFSYFGQDIEQAYTYNSGDNASIIVNSENKFSNLCGVGLFFGYSPIWNVSENVAIGLNMDIGAKANYKFNKWCFFNWDFGIIMKFN